MEQERDFLIEKCLRSHCDECGSPMLEWKTFKQSLGQPQLDSWERQLGAPLSKQLLDLSVWTCLNCPDGAGILRVDFDAA